MKLLILYGPPAVGKLTIANELVQLTGFRLFHNHLTQDLARELYPEFGEQRFTLVDKIRLDVIEYCAQQGTDLIHTLVYSGDDADDTQLSKVVSAVENAGGSVLFVELTAKIEDIVERIGNPSRTQFHKLTNPDIIKEKLEQGQFGASVKYDGIYSLDTSQTDPQTTAEKIVEHFNLKKVKP